MSVRAARLFATGVLALVAGCLPGPSTTVGPPIPAAEARYGLVDQVGQPAFCDPDAYPVGRDEMASMRERFPEIERDAATMTAILARLGVDPAGPWTDEERLAIYREWKLLNAIGLDDPTGAFDVIVGVDDATGAGVRITGTIAPDGTITVVSETPGAVMSCPICLALGTRISGPEGDVRIEDVRPGMTIWSVDAHGDRTLASVVRVARTLAPIGHRVVRLELADGRRVTASPGHPLLDGRSLGDLRIGDPVDGSTVTSILEESYGGDFTHDLLATGPTGGYVADGIALGSTLRPAARP